MVDKCGNNDLHKVEEILEICITVLRKYSWLTQAYVLVGCSWGCFEIAKYFTGLFREATLGQVTEELD